MSRVSRLAAVLSNWPLVAHTCLWTEIVTSRTRNLGVCFFLFVLMDGNIRFSFSRINDGLVPRTGAGIISSFHSVESEYTYVFFGQSSRQTGRNEGRIDRSGTFAFIRTGLASITGRIAQGGVPYCPTVSYGAASDPDLADLDTGHCRVGIQRLDVDMTSMSWFE